MRVIREILRIRFEFGSGHREIGRAVNKSPSTVGLCLSKFEAAGLSWPLPYDLSDEELEMRLYPAPPVLDDDEVRPEPDWEYVARELHKKHVTLNLLWKEYQKAHADENPYQYTWFCDQFREWESRKSVTMRQNHKAGEKMLVDWAGTKVPILNDKTGEVTEASIFVATLGLSSYTYVEAFENEQTPAWIAGHTNACQHFGGVGEITVPDNAKTGVTKADYCEPEINPVYYAWSEHYKTAIIPARRKKPKDKAKVESGVKVSGMWILAAIRNMTFYSVSELNATIWELLEDLNDKPFQKRPGSRRSWFEEQEKAALKPLPAEPFEIFEFKKARVAPDYHVQVEGHFYSVPFTLVKEILEVRIRPRIVQFFHRDRMVAVHRRSAALGAHTTLHEHMPANHRHQVEWTPERFESWALHHGASVRDFVVELMKRKQHPEQAFRSCFGLMRLAKEFGSQRLDAACLRALTLGAFRYKSVKSILKKGLDSRPLPSDASPPSRSAGHHENVRGSAYYNEQLDLFRDN
ncbi:MAG: IS21 family transposase [Vulcanimicrobiota bacterium]